jgi:hypothetical protein
MLSFHISEVEAMLTEHGGTFGEDFSGAKVIEAARAHALHLAGGEKPTQVPINTHIERIEDMGPGRLRLFREEDGDMCLTVIDKDGVPATIQFCTYFGGGGQSPKVLKALYDLASAMLEENASSPQHNR